MAPSPLYSILARLDHLDQSSTLYCTLTDNRIVCSPTHSPIQDSALISYSFYDHLCRHGTGPPQLSQALAVYSEEWWQRMRRWYPDMTWHEERRFVEQEAKRIRAGDGRFMCKANEASDDGVECRFSAERTLGRSRPMPYLENGSAVLTKGFLEALLSGRTGGGKEATTQDTIVEDAGSAVPPSSTTRTVGTREVIPGSPTDLKIREF